MKQKPFTFLSKKGYVQPITQIFRYACLATMVAGPIFSEAKVLPRYVQSVADTKVTGKVTDAKGEPIPGVAVRLKGTNKGANTDVNGNFSLSTADNAVLVISSVGYETQEVPVNGRSSINITLQNSSKELDEVVFVGYGTQRKMDVTGAVVSVKGEEISKQASVNAVSSLQGKVAGVQISNSGAPGASPQIRIRGLGTVYGNPNPLYVVDGVWFDDISFLNPADIESMNVLKDASAQSIYGIRAANGVILITTKKGKAEQTTITYNASYGVQRVSNQLEMANANEFATMVNELSTINGGSQVLDPSKFSKGTDWYRVGLRSAPVTNHQISLAGGSEKSTYNFSLGYLNQAGLVEGNNFDRYTARLQNDYQLFKHLKVGYSVTGAASTSKDAPPAIFRQLYSAAPVVPVYYADGTYGDPSDYNLGDGANYNPQATLNYYNQKTTNYRLTGNVFADLNFAKHFTFHTSIGGEFRQTEVRNYTPVFVATLRQRTTVSTLNLGRAENRNWILENTLSYDNTFNKDHNVRVLVGQSAQSYRSYGINASAQNVPNTSEGDMYLTLGNVDGRQISDYGDLSTIASYFGRVNYAFKNRYMVNASLRADGSSKFAGNNRWGYFPSVGLGWVVSEEDFMKDQKIFDNLKFRASWGKVGNASVPANVSVLRVNQAANLTAIFGDQIYTGASINSVVPPTTYWERSVGTDIGVEMAFLKNKLTFEADYYNRKTEMAIFDIPIPSSIGTGSSTITGNQADIQNRGYEFVLNYRNTISKDLSFSIGGNIGINDNKVLRVVTGANPIYSGGAASTGGALATRTIEGQPIGQFFGYIVDGIFQNTAEVAASAQKNAKPGDFKYRDISGPDGKPDGVISDLDRAPLGNPNPKFSYGINTNWNYKQFDLMLDFQGVAGVDIYNANLGLRYGNENFTKDFYNNRWHGEGTSNTYPSVNIGGGDNYRPNSFFVESGAYFRVRNIQLGYSLPSTITDKLHIKKLRVFANAQNALNFFKYRGFTPEVTGAYNSSGAATSGTSATINAGIDNNVYPMYATYNFGLNVTF